MKNIFKQPILILIGFLITPGLYSQNQKDITVFLKEKFVGYCNTVPREEVFLHSDRKDYMSGEDMWFNIYVIDRKSFKPSLNSRIVYFELLNNDNRPVVQKRFLTEKGVGPGQIHLPDTLSTGRYTIRAYTSWMKNFLPSNCFMNVITVYNSLGEKTVKSEVRKENRNGTGDNFKAGGVNLNVNNDDQGSLILELMTDDKFRSENNNSFCIFIQTHGNINHVSNEKTAGILTALKINRTKLGEGINQITVFNMKGEPVAEEYIYTPVRRDKFMTMTVADSCSMREKISLGFDNSSATDTAYFSISTAPLIINSGSPDIVKYLIFGSEFGTELHDLIKDISNDELSVEFINSNLQNVHSNWINWPMILSNQLPVFKYPMENRDHYLLGQLVTNNNEPVLTPSYILMSSPGQAAGFQYARTGRDGNFKLKIHIDDELKDLIIMPDEIIPGQKIIIESAYSDRYLGGTSVADPVLTTSSREISKLSVNHQVQKIYGISSLGEPLHNSVAPVIPLRFYGKPDVELILANYIKLPVMSEIFFELLPSVSLKKKKSVDEISITYRVGDDQFTTNPSLMIDGVIIKDASLISNLDPELVERIDVIRENYMVGKYVFNGLLNVITKTGDFSNVTLPGYMIRMPYRVIETVSSFVSPEYPTASQKDNRIPDYRNTIYWNTSVGKDADGVTRAEFWSSDNTGKYLINVQGITNNGRPFSIHKVITVK